MTPLYGVSTAIHKNVLDAMQPAEELGGPDMVEYVNLMLTIARECMERANTAVANIGHT